VLALLVVLLALVLIRRITVERRQMAVLRRLDLEQFAALLRSNGRQGVIGQVASGVSDLLKNSFGCERILFLRKKRGRLRHNFSHGLEAVDRRTLNMPYSEPLGRVLRDDYLPRRLFDLRDTLPSDFYQRLVDLGFDTFFPVFWRDNLYGVYFIRSTLETREDSFRSLVASLAQGLSAAYHVKWHESRQEDLSRKLSSVEREAHKNQVPELSSMMKLVRVRKPETIVPRIVESLVAELGLDRAAYLHQWDDRGLNIESQGIGASPAAPEERTLSALISRLADRKHVRLVDLETADKGVGGVVQTFTSRGLKYITAYSLAPEHRGVLAWSGGGDPKTVNERLESLRGHICDLVDNAESFVRVEEMSYTDNLTGLANQRYFLRRLDEEISRAKRYGRHLALILFDLDELKSANDTYGHLAGDAILRQLGEILRNSIRSIDVVARYGGDEFCVIMPEADQQTCRQFMKRLQIGIARTSFRLDEGEQTIQCTVSLGGAIFPDHGEDARSLIHTADMALLKAKESGRNNWRIYEPEG